MLRCHCSFKLPSNPRLAVSLSMNLLSCQTRLEFHSNIFIYHMFHTVALCLRNRRFDTAEIAFIVSLNCFIPTRPRRFSFKPHANKVNVFLGPVSNFAQEPWLTRYVKRLVLCLSVFLDMAIFSETTISFDCARGIHITSLIFLERHAHFIARN